MHDQLGVCRAIG